MDTDKLRRSYSMAARDGRMSQASQDEVLAMIDEIERLQSENNNLVSSFRKLIGTESHVAYVAFLAAPM